MESLIIHLSDLHFKNDAESRFRLQCLRDDLNRLRHPSPIHTAFTGDLINAGDENMYQLLFDELIGPLIELGHEIFVIPGNHDVQRSVATPHFADSHLLDRTSSYLFDSNGNLNHYITDAQLDPLANYRSFEELFGPYSIRTYWGFLRTIGSISFVGLNSTWLSRYRNAGESDRGQLRIEPYILEKLAKAIPDGNLKIVLMHHPLDWLEETTRDAVSKLITNNFQLALFGHVHASDLSSLTHGVSGCVFVQSPPLRAGWSKGTNGYSIIRCNIEHQKFEIDYRSYSASRRTFVRGEDFAASGRKHPRIEDAEFFRRSPSGGALIQRHTDSAPHDYTDWYRNHIRAKSKYIGPFVIPKARKVPADQEDSWLEPVETITGIVNRSSRDQFFVAPMDAGATTAAFLVFKALSETISRHDKVPAYFDASREKINRASIIRSIHQTSLAQYTHDECARLAEEGTAAIIVDGLSLADVDQFNVFRETSDKFFPKVRFIYFLGTERRGMAGSSHGLPTLNSNEDEIYEFAELDVSDIREMVELQKSAMSTDVSDAMVSQVVDSFRQMDEPIFASSVAVVIQTLSQDPEFKPLNKARLIERYVECLLGRFDLEDVREGAFSSSDKIDLLSYIARKMLETDLIGLSEDDWSSACDAYQEFYLIGLPKGLLDEFIEKGLLTLDLGRITFRGDYLFSFFVARQMKVDSGFAKSLLSDDGIFKYHREIVFYGDLEGTDTGSVLNMLYTILGELEEVLLENYSREGVDLGAEWRNACAESADESASTAAFADAGDRLDKAEPTREHADRVSDEQLAGVLRRRGVAQRVLVQHAEARLLVAMKLYALLLKNALQLPADDKLRHLRKLYESAELWVGFLCAMRAQVGVLPVVYSGGICFINAGAVVDAGRSAREFKFNAPNTISRILSESIRNPQMSVALRRVLPMMSPMGALFVRDALLELPGVENRSTYVRSLADAGDINLITSSLRTLRVRFLASGRSREQRESIGQIVEALRREASIAGEFNLTQLKRAGLVRELKENARGRRD